ncbi:putative oxidoreductase CipA [Mytilinidion resinicola]|uniref:Oxidoreductase CipA n=1 Tax=Mytilinidion resinicola TaxID=574789 RepID=A0A6A6ZBC8_9PEZI|nr:putative oxidoreductase CipA [Mytilinidion resinicola]KAF2818003.1 putative oxidoreductase CipA [Mytilinidion resinicola]
MAHIEKVAIVGAGGRVGGAFAKELLRSGKHIITAITRKGSKSALPKGIKVAEVDYDDRQALISALKGHQFLIITLSVTAPGGLHGNIVKAAGEARIPYVMPNMYGSDIQNPAIMEESMNGRAYKERLADFDGVDTSWVALVCGFWYEWSLALDKATFGFDIAGRSVTFYDDGNTKIDVSTWDQCGRAIARLLSLPESGASPCVADWKNKPLYINSFKVSQRDMLDSLHRVLGTTDKDWTIDFEPTDQRLKRGLEDWKNGNRLGFAMASYARVLYPNGDGDFESKWGTSNQVLGLPKEDLDEATKRVVEMVENGWSPFKQ